MTVGIVDVGIGNLGSVRQAVYNLGWDPVLVSKPEDFPRITHLLLPGVGAFNSAMEKLKNAQLVESIQSFALDGNPILGICLGMQLLATQGMEGGLTCGLNLIPGRIEPIQSDNGLRVPHVGWNEARQKRKHPLLKGIRDDVDFYFVHSFRFVADDERSILAETEYGTLFPSIVGQQNVVGAQFHPEKSQLNGMRILDNFCVWDGSC